MATAEITSDLPSPQPDKVEYVVLVAAGLDDIAVKCMIRMLGESVSIRRVLHPPASAQWAAPPPEPRGLLFPGEAASAKLLVTLPRPTTNDGWQAQHAALAALPCTQALLAPLELASGIALKAEALKQVHEATLRVSVERWDAAMITWRQCRVGPMGLLPAGHQEDGSITFRASALRDGKHEGFHAPQLAQEVGAAVFESRGLHVSLKRYQLEVVVVLLQSELLLAINLVHGAAGQFKAKLGPEPRPLLPHADSIASLRSSTAYLMLELARVQPGEILLDPMCGIGTLPLVGAASAPCACAIAGDVDAHVLHQAALNGEALRAAQRRAISYGSSRLLFGTSTQVGGQDWHADARHFSRQPARGGVLPCLWSSAALPLRDHSVDVVAVDLPFGITHKVHGGMGGLRKLYARSFAEITRVVRPGGRFVALATSRRALTESMAALEGMWATQSERQVNCGGGFAWVLLWERTNRPFVTEVSAAAVLTRNAPQVKTGSKELERRRALSGLTASAPRRGGPTDPAAGNGPEGRGVALLSGRATAAVFVLMGAMAIATARALLLRRRGSG